ncbi:hypothetical protein ETD86_13595 [Nonomuraea turkmeniaca]|uniref:Uncharacterized protein n=1 Tax=Nonomuraea turkmeniaca TaxID=103838 RepID=A0A5S4FM72_9ACTN|nr:hypothetical protein [Nonomuraea turkmeniaca]TMR21828.1 hypothetical protein ETD86_13595 [Nonomuraea turkmeniaca]
MNRASRRAIALIGLIVLASACGLFPRPVYHVNPAALKEVRSIGTLKEEGSDEVDYAGAIETYNVLVIDVGGRNGEEALDKAVDILRQKEWKVVGQGSLMTSMESDKWDGHLTATPFHPYQLQHYPNILEALKDKSTRTEALVIITMNARRSGL